MRGREGGSQPSGGCEEPGGVARSLWGCEGVRGRLATLWGYPKESEHCKVSEQPSAAIKAKPRRASKHLRTTKYWYWTKYFMNSLYSFSDILAKKSPPCISSRMACLMVSERVPDFTRKTMTHLHSTETIPLSRSVNAFFTTLIWVVDTLDTLDTLLKVGGLVVLCYVRLT